MDPANLNPIRESLGIISDLSKSSSSNKNFVEQHEKLQNLVYKIINNKKLIITDNQAKWLKEIKIELMASPKEDLSSLKKILEEIQENNTSKEGGASTVKKLFIWGLGLTIAGVAALATGIGLRPGGKKDHDSNSSTSPPRTGGLRSPFYLAQREAAPLPLTQSNQETDLELIQINKTLLEIEEKTIDPIKPEEIQEINEKINKCTENFEAIRIFLTPEEQKLIEQKIKNLKDVLLISENFNEILEGFSKKINYLELKDIIIANVRYYFNKSGKKNSNEALKRLWNAAKETIPLKGKKITWITGSRSASLIGIERVATTALAEKKAALVPSGMLLKHKIAPLTGELFKGIFKNGVNQRYLSGMPLQGLGTCVSYAEGEGFQFNAESAKNAVFHPEDNQNVPFSARRISLLRLLLMDKLTLEEKNDLKKKLQLEASALPVNFCDPDWKKGVLFLGAKMQEKGDYAKIPGEIRKGQLITVDRSDGSKSPGIVIELFADDMFKVAIGNGNCKIVSRSNLYSFDEAKIEKHTDQPTSEEEIRIHLVDDREMYEEMLSWIGEVKPLELTKDDLSLITDSFPLVWGSSTIKKEQLKEVDSSLSTSLPYRVAKEIIVEGVQKLGDDIQFVFTDQQHVDRLKKVVEKHGVIVLSFDAAHYLMGAQELAAGNAIVDVASFLRYLRPSS